MPCVWLFSVYCVFPGWLGGSFDVPGALLLRGFVDDEETKRAGVRRVVEPEARRRVRAVHDVAASMMIEVVGVALISLRFLVYSGRMHAGWAPFKPRGRDSCVTSWSACPLLRRHCTVMACVDAHGTFLGVCKSQEMSRIAKGTSWANKRVSTRRAGS